MNKICPLMSRTVTQSYNDECPNTLIAHYEPTDCQKSNCAFWVSGYTTEKVPIQCCAFEFMALKNAEGLYRV
jgi:hypothetical protein